MKRPIVNIDELEYQPHFKPHGDAFDGRMAMIGPRIGAQKLGYNATAVPPGKRAFPFHSHRVNEEMFFVLEGTGELRIGAERFAIRKGDVIACPPGGPEAAHQIINTGTVELRYLAVSTKMTPEIAEYPDSNKFGVLADFGASADGKPNMFRFVGRVEQNLDYWDGEPSGG